jgi:class 3 adenylate cyclase
MAKLRELLALRNRQPHRAGEIDEHIWREFGAECTVLISDMSGFTRTTREHGIVHFLAMHRQSLELAGPVIHSRGGAIAKEDADNLIALFDDPASAVDAAVALHRDVAAYNRTVEYARQIGVCIGISHGLVLRTEHEVFGDAVNVAYKLGEDIADPWDVLVADAAYSEIARAGSGTFEFGPREEVLIGKVILGFHRVVFKV